MPKNTGSVLVPLLAAVAIIALFAAGYFFWQNHNLTSRETSLVSQSGLGIVEPETSQEVEQPLAVGWLTYTNNFYDFSFQYPPGYQVWDTSVGTSLNTLNMVLYVVPDETANCLKASNCKPTGENANLLQLTIHKTALSPNLTTWVYATYPQQGDLPGPAIQDLETYETPNTTNGVSFHNTLGISDGPYSYAFYNPILRYVAEFNFKTPLQTTEPSHKIVDSFKFLNVKTSLKKPLPVKAFDGCGKIENYSKEPWFSDFKSQIGQANLSEASIADACLALDKSRLIALLASFHCSGPEILYYETASHVLEFALVNGHSRGCLASSDEFGKRVGAIVPLKGYYGDAGCELNQYFNYDLTTNIVELKKEEGACQQEPWQTTYY